MVDYVLPPTDALGWSQAGSLQCVAFVLDETLDVRPLKRAAAPRTCLTRAAAAAQADELVGARDALQRAADTLPDDTTVCLLTAGASVAVFSLAPPPAGHGRSGPSGSHR